MVTLDEGTAKYIVLEIGPNGLHWGQAKKVEFNMSTEGLRDHEFKVTIAP